MGGSSGGRMPISGHWRNPGWRRCDSKIGYRYSVSAEKVARRMSIKSGELLVAYRCFDCGSFHVGHGDLAQILVRQERDLPRPPTLPATCPRCDQCIPDERRVAALAAGTKTVYCSKDCQKKHSRKLRREKRRTREEAEVSVATSDQIGRP